MTNCGQPHSLYNKGSVLTLHPELGVKVTGPGL
jgi:hypothetical protein